MKPFTKAINPNNIKYNVVLPILLNVLFNLILFILFAITTFIFYNLENNLPKKYLDSINRFVFD